VTRRCAPPPAVASIATRPLRFSFDGRSYQGLAGDTLASALLANGVHLMGRSFKYHRPRGVLAAGAEEPNALVSVRRDAARYTPNLRATQVELYDGLEAHSQNRWPSLAFDVGAISDLLSPLFPAGFYYKTFMWPRGGWKALRALYPRRRRSGPRARPSRSGSLRQPLRALRRAGGRGGPAGLAAALAAADAWRTRHLCDEQAQFGGSLLADATRSRHRSSRCPVAGAQPRVAAQHARVTLLPRTTAFGYFPHNLIALNQRLTDHLAIQRTGQTRERCWQVRAREVVLATGAIERPLVFPGNDRPGIMLAGSGTQLAQSLRRGARHARGGDRTPAMRPTGRRSICTRPASRSR
jgi:sarcosine oxidase subunit alpha